MDAITKPKQRRDAVATKARILAAAEYCFSEVGYAKTGIRDVAAHAGISYALISRYYTSKAGLFEAALEKSMSNLAVITSVDRDHFGAHLAESIVSAMQGNSMGAMLILAAADPTAREIGTRVVEAKVIEPLARWLGAPAGRDRAVAITMLGAGFITHARLMPLVEVGPTAIPDHPIIGWLAESLQRIVDQNDR